MNIAAALIWATLASAISPSPNAEDATYVFLGVTQTKVGPQAATYVSVDEAGGGDVVRTWVLDVFETPASLPQGQGAYSTGLQRFDCKTRDVHVLKGDLYDAKGGVLDSYAGDFPFPAPPAGSTGAATLSLVCGKPPAADVRLHGIGAALADAARRRAG